MSISKQHTVTECNMAEPNTRSRLLELPLELRDEIYLLATSTSSVRLKFCGADTKRTFRAQNGLLLTNRQIHTEYMATLWRHFLNSTWTLRLEDPDVKDWMGMAEALSSDERKRLKVVMRLEVDLWVDIGKQWMRELRRWLRFCERTGLKGAEYELVPVGYLLIQNAFRPEVGAVLNLKRVLERWCTERMKRDCEEWKRLHQMVM